jgi:hypothetical protein
MTFKVNIKFRNKNMDVFVIATNEQLEFEGEAGDFYGKTD